MADEGFLLSQEDLQILRWVIEREKSRVATPVNREPYEYEPDIFTPDFYEALSPSPSGIPAMSGTTPGSAVCRVYKLVSGVLYDTGFDRTVRNVGPSAVTAGTYVHITRDKFGDWFVIPSAGSAGGTISVVTNTVNVNSGGVFEYNSGSSSDYNSGSTSHFYSGSSLTVDSGVTVLYSGYVEINEINFTLLVKDVSEVTISVGSPAIPNPPSAFWLHATVSGDRGWEGWNGTGIPEGRWYEVTNVGSGVLTIYHEDLDAGLGSKFYCNLDRDLKVAQWDTVFIQRIITASEDGFLVAKLGDTRYQMSITGDEFGVKLVNDASSPGNTKLYGTDSAGVKGWYSQPSGGALTDGDKVDITVSDSGATWTIDNNVVTYAKMQDVSATSRVLGRKTAGAGDTEECTLSEVLDFVGSAAQGDILYRGASVWARLGAGTSGQFLKTQGAGANPIWSALLSGGSPARVVGVPGSPSSVGTAGDVAMSTSHFYFCYAANSWLRVLGSAW